MDRTPLEPPVADAAPIDEALTDYDREHFVTYIRLLDADEAGVDWRDAAEGILHIDPDRDFVRARRVYESHLARAQWMTREGFKYLLRDDPYAK